MVIVKFTQMKDGTREDYQLLHGLESQYQANHSAPSSRSEDGIAELG